MLKCLMVLLVQVATSVLTRSLQYRNMCGEINGRQIYLELGVQGSIVASTQNKQTSRYTSIFKAENSTQQRQCSLELVTCPSCVISLQFTFLNISRNCGDDFLLEDCSCDYVLIFEVPYEEISSQQFCGDFIESKNASLFYVSQTRGVTVKFIYSSDYEIAFSLKYFSRKNQYFIEGSPDFAGLNNVEQYVTSPFFPKYYPRDASIEYVIKCKSTESCKVAIIFVDFQISKYSIIEFFDWKGERMFAASGSVFRPPILISPSPMLKVKFYANGGTDLGFKAICSFLLEKELVSVKNVNTVCGGYVDNLGGRISMMNMIENGTVFYDCIWIIRPFQSYLFAKTHLYVKITKLTNFDAARVVVTEGSTSSGEIVEILTYFPQGLSTGKEHVIPINEGFFVNLKANFQAGSVLEIVYAAIGYANCSSVSDFSCKNRRCISHLLYCDGFNHCGDNSDEPDTCSQEGKVPQRKHTPNFYFANSERYVDLKTVTVVFIISSLALISLMLSLIILLYRINVRSNDHRHLQSHFQAINDFLESSLGIEEVEEIIVDDGPPKYEAPPDYKEVVKRVRRSVKKNIKRKSVTKSGIRSKCTKTYQNGMNTDDLDQNSASTSAVCKSIKSDEKSGLENTSANSPQDENKIIIQLVHSSSIFEGAKNLMDSLNIDLPICKNIKGKLFTKRLLTEIKDWQNSNINSVRLSVCRRIFSASNLTLYSTDSKQLDYSGFQR